MQIRVSFKLAVYIRISAKASVAVKFDIFKQKPL